MTLLLTLFAGIALADPPPGYYDSVDDSNGEALRRTLHNLIRGHTRFPYTSSSTDTWDILEEADQNPANPGEILDLYQNRTFTKFGGGEGPYNREHSWPNSYGFSSKGDTAYTDCHHLFLCDMEYNGARGNDPFGPCETSCTTYATDVNDGQGGSGQSNFSGFGMGTDVWETWIGRRGDVARAMFYMDVRYEAGGSVDLRLTDNAALIASSDGPVAYMGLRATLLQWHVEDPVDDRERRHNDVVYSYQGNRNPFVDHPEWVDTLVPVQKTSLGGMKALYR